MNNNLHILTCACTALQRLKHREGIYKRAVLIGACDNLCRKKGCVPMHKNAGWVGPTTAALATAGLTYLFTRHGREMFDDVQRGLNSINSDWGQGAVIRRANKGDMTPAERHRYLLTRLGRSANYAAARDAADSALYARRAFARRRASKLLALTRGQRILDNAYARSLDEYDKALAAFDPGYTYGIYRPYSID